jgi:hypothetical protein
MGYEAITWTCHPNKLQYYLSEVLRRALFTLSVVVPLSSLEVSSPIP